MKTIAVILMIAMLAVAPTQLPAAPCELSQLAVAEEVQEPNAQVFARPRNAAPSHGGRPVTAASQTVLAVPAPPVRPPAVSFKIEHATTAHACTIPLRI